MCKTSQKSNRWNQRDHQSKFRSLIQGSNQVKQDQNMTASGKYTVCVPWLQMAASHIGNVPSLKANRLTFNYIIFTSCFDGPTLFTISEN